MTYSVVFTPAATTNGKAGFYPPGLCTYNSYMRFVWDEAKPISNLRDHEIDFVDAEQVFAGLTSTFDDTEDVTLVVYRKLNSPKQCSPTSRVWRRWKPVT